MSISAALDQFIADPKPKALVLQGTWGRGKTHLWNARWNAYCESLDGKELPRKYAYVSLFGVETLGELKAAIWAASLQGERQSGIERSDMPTSILARKKGWQWNLRKPSRSAIEIGTQVEGSVPWLGPISQIVKALASYAVRDMVVCLDDIERRGSSLRLLDVMGFVAQITEQSGCSVLVILNRDSLGIWQSDWDDNREKVFRNELTFAPTSEECVSLILPPEAIDFAILSARNGLIELNVTNIRIVERVRMALEAVRIVLTDLRLSEDTHYRIGRALALIVYCHSGRGEGAPSLAYALRHSPYSSFLATSPRF